MERTQRPRTIDRLQHDSDLADGAAPAEQTIDLTQLHEDNAVDRTIDPVTGEAIYTTTPVDQDWQDDTRGYGGPVPPAEIAAYPPPETRVVRERIPEYLDARGGFSLWALVSGALTAFGLMTLAGLAVGVIVANANPDAINSGTAVSLGTTAAVVFVAAQFISYLLGGYTAGRMSRGAGMLHGLLVPVLALGVGALIVWGISAAGDTARLALPFQQGRFAIDRSTLVDFGVAIGIASLIAMFVGGAVGGMMGSQWHRRLERRAAADTYYDTQVDEAV